MERAPVKSSNIKAIGYDAATQTLEVEFHGGAVWLYSGISAEVHAEIAKAESVGRWFNARIKGKFEGKRIPETASHVGAGKDGS